MSESPVSTPGDEKVQAALQDYLERVDRGEDVDRDAFLAEHADIADELRSFIETSEDLAQIAGGATSSAARADAQTLVPQKVQGQTSPTDSRPLPAKFGRYRVIRPLGSGAMGTVYLAEDTQLVADRTSDPLAWDNARPLLLDGERLLTHGVHYCGASGELFFTRANVNHDAQLWVARPEE